MTDERRLLTITGLSVGLTEGMKQVQLTANTDERTFLLALAPEDARAMANLLHKAHATAVTNGTADQMAKFGIMASEGLEVVLRSFHIGTTLDQAFVKLQVTADPDTKISINCTPQMALDLATTLGGEALANRKGKTDG